jgi:hypothetical protein
MKATGEHEPAERGRKAKKQHVAGFGSRRILVLAGGAVGCVVLLGGAAAVTAIVAWFVMRGVSTGAAFGAVAAYARPAGGPKGPINPSPHSFPAVNIPITGEGWNVTPDAVPATKDLVSAVVLPDGKPRALRFAEPARARAAVVLADPVIKPKENAPIGVSAATVSPEWLQIDLQSGAIAARIPLGTHVFVSDANSRLPAMFDNAALSPSGDRLAAFVPKGKELALVVWDSVGKLLQEWTDPQLAGYFLAFVTDDRLLARGATNLVGLEVSSGRRVFTAVEAPSPPFALSAGHRWLGAVGPQGDLIVIDTATGVTAGRQAKPLASGKPIASLAFTPDGKAITASEHATKLQWLTPRHVVVQDTLFDRNRNLALWKYEVPKWGMTQTAAVVAPSTPDGRLWYVSAFNDPFARPVDEKQFTPGSLANAVKGGKLLLAAFAVPHAALRERISRAEQGIAIRRSEPLRVEVVGSASGDMKKEVAEATAEALAKRGWAIDPAAPAGVRIKLTGPKSVTVVTKDPFAPPGFQINKNSARSGYEIGYAVCVFGQGVSETPPLTTHSLSGFADEQGRLDAFFRHVGARAGDFGIPLEGFWDRDGPIEILGTSRLGIDGVLMP